jgi:hypothetical protein
MDSYKSSNVHILETKPHVDGFWFDSGDEVNSQYSGPRV